AGWQLCPVVVDLEEKGRGADAGFRDHGDLLQSWKYTAPLTLVSWRGSPPSALTTKSWGKRPSKETKASRLPSGDQRTRPQRVLRNVTCRCPLPSRFMVQTLATPPFTAM